MKKGTKSKAKKKKIKTLEIDGIKKLDILTKLRLAVISIFVLSTLSILLVFVTGFVIPVFLVLISYVMVFVLMIKLLIIKKL